MNLYVKAFKLLFNSILNNDILILFSAILTIFFMCLVIISEKAIKRRKEDWKKERNIKFTKFLLNCLKKTYTLFVTMISIFPLLGMLGTVLGLLGLDLASGDMENIKENFFIALTSTAWGIIFSVIFKIPHAFIVDDVEEQIETARELSKEMYREEQVMK